MYPLYRQLVGPHSQYKLYKKENNFLPLPEIEPLILGRPACILVAIATELDEDDGRQ
jgi:hypothetical protein